MKKTILIFLTLFCTILNAKAQEVKINDNFVVESDGTLRHDNSGTIWDDLSIPGMNAKPGVASPDWAVYKGGIFLWMFKGTGTDEVCFTVQMPHSWKVGSDIKPHIHWVPTTAPASNNVTWTLEYFWVNIGGTVGATTTITSSTVTVGTPGIDTHLITGLGTISGAGKTLSSILVCRLYRDGGNPSDTYADPAALLQADFHYEKDTEGSRSEYTK